MLRSLRAQLATILLGYLLLVGGSVTATSLAVGSQADDATLINLAGRQRMLIQKMSWLALTRPDGPEIVAAAQLFDQTLNALRSGGPAVVPAGQTVVLPPAPDPALRAQLDEAARAWVAFRSHLSPPDVAALQAESPLIVARIDSIVSAFEARAEAKLLRLQRIQFAFLAAALLLLAWGLFVTRRRLLAPLASLGSAARRMAGGLLADPVTVDGDDEMGAVGRAFETMRAEVAASREHLESRVAQRTRELASAFEFSQEIVAQPDLGHLLRSVTDRARELTRARAASLCLLDEGQSTLVLAASSGNGRMSPHLRQSILHEPVRRVIGGGETVVAEAACFQCGFLQGYPLGPCAAAPLHAGDSTLGAMCVVREAAHPFDADETRALTLLANSAAIAIANARLAEAGRRQAEHSAALAERERLAADLHDHLAQTLSFLKLKADRIPERLAAGETPEAEAELERMKSAIEEAYGQVRSALVGLRQPPAIADDLVEKLHACLAAFREAAGLPAELVITDASALALPRATQAQVVHIVREALANVRRHARARRAWVRVDRTGDAARFTVADDGEGFDPLAVPAEDHLGLVIMRTRAERSGGALTIESAPGAGTRVIATFPPRLDGSSG